MEERTFAPLPSFEPEFCSACGRSCRELTGHVVQQKAKREACLLRRPEVELLVDGAAVPMVHYVQHILRPAVLGVVKELRGFKARSRIEVRLRT